MAGRVSPVSSRARYMATWRGQARRAARLAREELVAGEAEASAAASWMASIGRRGAAGAGRARTG